MEYLLKYNYTEDCLLEILYNLFKSKRTIEIRGKEYFEIDIFWVSVLMAGRNTYDAERYIEQNSNYYQSFILKKPEVISNINFNNLTLNLINNYGPIALSHVGKALRNLTDTIHGVECLITEGENGDIILRNKYVKLGNPDKKILRYSQIIFDNPFKFKNGRKEYTLDNFSRF